MQANEQFQPVYRFEDFELDLQLQELRQNGDALHIEPQVFALLVLLVSNSHRMIPRQELLNHVWNGRTVSDSAVNSRIRSARTILGDDGKAQRLIRTVHNRGFRFVGKLLRDPAADAAPAFAHPDNRPDNRPDSSNALPSVFPLRLSPGADGRDTGITIAVRTFESRSDKADRNQFADGVCENVIVALAKQPRLRTVALHAEPEISDSGSPAALRQTIPAFQYLLEGCIQYSGHRMRLTARLIEGATGRHVWAERYDRRQSEIFALHDELTRKIVSALQTQIASGVQADTWSSGTESFPAWEALMTARELCLTHRRKPVLEGRSMARKALALDPGYAAAWHWIAYSFWAEAKEDWGLPKNTILQRAVEAINKGLELQPNDANIHALLALVQASAGKFDLALPQARRAMVMGPGNAHVFSNAGLVLLYGNRPEEAVAVLRKAAEYAPLHCAGTSAILATALWLCGDMDAALAEAEYGLRIDPEYCSIHPTMAAILAEQGRLGEARVVVRELLRICPRFSRSGYVRNHRFRDPAILERIFDALHKSGFSDESDRAEKRAI
ncbi:MAG: winged helix-turn-helix domain-containing protein [Pseudomonadota bacterium]